VILFVHRCHLPHLKVRQNRRSAPVPLGSTSDGQRELLGMDIGTTEAETFWTPAPAQARAPRRDPARKER
jgi:Transposase, Mutator family